MNTYCGAPLFRSVEDGLEITTRSCSRVLYDIGICDGSYLYLRGSFLYTFVCPVEKTVKILKKATNFSAFNLTNVNNASNAPNSGNSSLGLNLSRLLPENNKSNSSNSSNSSSNSSAINNASLYLSISTGSYSSTLNLPIIVIASVLFFLSVLSCAVWLYINYKKRRRNTLKKRPSSSVMPVVIQEKKNKIPIEVRQTLRKMISTVCKWHGERPYRLDKAPESEPPIPPRPPTKREKTLDFLRNTNPHSTIQRALQKPVENSEDAGARRAELFRRETALEARRQQNLKTRRGNSRLKRVARLRQLASKNEET